MNKIILTFGLLLCFVFLSSLKSTGVTRCEEDAVSSFSIQGEVVTISANCISIEGCLLQGATVGYIKNFNGEPIIAGGYVVKVGDTGLFEYADAAANCGRFVLVDFTPSGCD